MLCGGASAKGHAGGGGMGEGASAAVRPHVLPNVHLYVFKNTYGELFASLSLSLSHTHTHTHKHTSLIALAHAQTHTLLYLR